MQPYNGGSHSDFIILANIDIPHTFLFGGTQTHWLVSSPGSRERETGEDVKKKFLGLTNFISFSGNVAGQEDRCRRSLWWETNPSMENHTSKYPNILVTNAGIFLL